jgi:hypothetical protein
MQMGWCSWANNSKVVRVIGERPPQEQANGKALPEQQAVTAPGVAEAAQEDTQGGVTITISESRGDPPHQLGQQ